MASIRSRADELVKEDHPKPEQVMKCSDLVYTRWQQLMKKAKEKQQVVMASYNFFKTSEQVWRFSTKFHIIKGFIHACMPVHLLGNKILDTIQNFTKLCKESLFHLGCIP